MLRWRRSADDRDGQKPHANNVLFRIRRGLFDAGISSPHNLHSLRLYRVLGPAPGYGSTNTQAAGLQPQPAERLHLSKLKARLNISVNNYDDYNRIKMNKTFTIKKYIFSNKKDCLVLCPTKEVYTHLSHYAQISIFSQVFIHVGNCAVFD